MVVCSDFDSGGYPKTFNRKRLANGKLKYNGFLQHN